MVLYTVYADCDPITAGQVKKKDQVIRMRSMEMMMMLAMATLKCKQNSQPKTSIQNLNSRKVLPLLVLRVAGRMIMMMVTLKYEHNSRRKV